MANEAKKIEHSGAKKGKGAYWGYKKDAKKEPNRVRREADKTESIPGLNEQEGGQ
ncbi:hypothetical protein HTZ97_16590 [Desulfuromonas acetoxidans]|uniref:hypothetical protein n=1 Tax=Desulfuromonas acetoxidans TaxID=891 RepID=UPI0002D52BC4|nr:hypothetical protein [Desulfuromonas acetoxidans]MBF0646541.1 hypothetical protein [Desulfuromonas acetoxidans]NVD26046.1 hypothetical protein [Desulfuromonas acetoxidans]NVE18075.1 hypothetical protein [Desulfuromonas acetoxidans]